MTVRAAGLEPANMGANSLSLSTGATRSPRRHSGAFTNFATLVIFILTGCASAPEIPKVVQVPVPVSCVKEAPAKPLTMDEKVILDMDEYSATITTWTERLLLKAYAEKAEALISACR